MNQQKLLTRDLNTKQLILADMKIETRCQYQMLLIMMNQRSTQQMTVINKLFMKNHHNNRQLLTCLLFQNIQRKILYILLLRHQATKHTHLIESNLQIRFMTTKWTISMLWQIHQRRKLQFKILMASKHCRCDPYPEATSQMSYRV